MLSIVFCIFVKSEIAGENERKREPAEDSKKGDKTRAEKKEGKGEIFC